MHRIIFIFNRDLEFIAQCVFREGRCILSYPKNIEPNTRLEIWAKEVIGRNPVITKEIKDGKRFIIVQKEIGQDSEEYGSALVRELRFQGFIAYAFDERMAPAVEEIVKGTFSRDDRLRALATMRNLNVSENGEELLAFFKKLKARESLRQAF